VDALHDVMSSVVGCASASSDNKITDRQTTANTQHHLDDMLTAALMWSIMSVYCLIRASCTGTERSRYAQQVRFVSFFYISDFFIAVLDAMLTAFVLTGLCWSLVPGTTIVKTHARLRCGFFYRSFFVRCVTTHVLGPCGGLSC